MVDKEKMDTCIDSMVQLMLEMKNALKNDDKPEDGPKKIPKKKLSNNPASKPIKTPKPRHPKPEFPELASPNDAKTFKQLKESVLSDNWPEAVNKALICDPKSESDKNERSRGIIELMIEEDLKGLKFLDIGCGEGHCAHISAEYDTTMSVGYDVNKHPKWKSFKKKNAWFTDNFDQVIHHEPYDVILIFDVIDHLEDEEITSLLKKAKSVLSENGKIYMRCHPFPSRTATHLYHDLNKAYLHLIFNEDELRELIPCSDHELTSTFVNKPLAHYGKSIKEADLREINRREITEKVEPFFSSPEIARRIQNKLKFDSFPNWQLSLQFIDYVLGKKKDS